MNTPDISDQYPEIPFLHGYKPFGNYHSLAGELKLSYVQMIIHWLDPY